MAEYTGYETLYDYCTILEPGIHTIMLSNDEIIPVDVIKLESEVIIDNDYIANEIPWSQDPDKNMVIIISDYDITIAENTILTTPTRAKGLVIFTNKKLTNLGTISMTARGAIAKGQDVLLYTNDDGSKEFIPAVGGKGGDKLLTGSSQHVIGNRGTNGINRQTGGGAGGSVSCGSSCKWNSYSGAGAYGTSYSGGSGGGGCAKSGGEYRIAENGADNGGKGGYGMSYTSSSWSYRAGGGAGNPGGSGNTYGQSGTGGLIIIYAKEFDNQNIISSDGSTGGYARGGDGGNAGGGGSGGGSINIFYSHILNEGTIQALGGQRSPSVEAGGQGGDGCVTLQEIHFFKNIIKNKNLTVRSFENFMRLYTRNLEERYTQDDIYTDEELDNMIENLWSDNNAEN